MVSGLRSDLIISLFKKRVFIVFSSVDGLRGSS